MQTKSSYRVLKWTFMVSALTTLATACVVSAGDGSTDLGDGGEGGTSSAGTSTSAGTNSTAGKGGSGGSSAGTTSGGTSMGGDATVEGGAPSTYVPGVCDDDLAVPSMPADTTLNSDDEKPEFACRKCLKMNCATPWSSCYGQAPTAACGYGSTEDAPGQFECIRGCYLDDMSGDDIETVLSNCESKCLDQCADKDQGFATNDTQDLLGCGQDKCLVDCFTP